MGWKGSDSGAICLSTSRNVLSEASSPACVLFLPSSSCTGRGMPSRWISLELRGRILPSSPAESESLFFERNETPPILTLYIVVFAASPSVAISELVVLDSILPNLTLPPVQSTTTISSGLNVHPGPADPRSAGLIAQLLGKCPGGSDSSAHYCFAGCASAPATNLPPSSKEVAAGIAARDSQIRPFALRKRVQNCDTAATSTQSWKVRTEDPGRGSVCALAT
eukprot:2528864-Rhodomonas_salina.2